MLPLLMLLWLLMMSGERKANNSEGPPACDHTRTGSGRAKWSVGNLCLSAGLCCSIIGAAVSCARKIAREARRREVLKKEQSNPPMTPTSMGQPSPNHLNWYPFVLHCAVAPQPADISLYGEIWCAVAYISIITLQPFRIIVRTATHPNHSGTGTGCVHHSMLIARSHCCGPTNEFIFIYLHFRRKPTRKRIYHPQYQAPRRWNSALKTKHPINTHEVTLLMPRWRDVPILD